MSRLPSTPAFLLSGSSGIIPQGEESSTKHGSLGLPGNRRTEASRKVQSIRMQQTMQQLHFIACDVAEEQNVRLGAAQELAMMMNRHFETIIWALRVAGGARKP